MKSILLASLGMLLPAFTTFSADTIMPQERIELFNGKDFTGWTFCTKSGTDPMATWSVTNGVIHCTGKPMGYIRTVQNYQNYELDVTWRFVKIVPKADNTGVLVHMQLPDKVWPKCIQVQGKHERQGDLFLMAGAESKEHQGMDANWSVTNGAVGFQSEGAEMEIKSVTLLPLGGAAK